MFQEYYSVLNNKSSGHHLFFQNTDTKKSELNQIKRLQTICTGLFQVFILMET